MAKKSRDYHAEYQAREERAHSHGFNSYWEERKYKEEHAEAIELGKEHAKERTEAGGYSFNPQLASAWWEAIGQYEGEDVSGEMRHWAVAYYMDWYDMDIDEAIDAMRDLYGDSGDE